MTKLQQQQLGQLLMCGFHGLEPTPEILHLIKHYHLGSIILFSRNIDTPAQVRRLTQQLQQAAQDAGHERPLFIAVDQENGVVRRLGSSGTYLPGNMALGAMGDKEAATLVASATARELRALGIQWNLAPVMDVNNNALNPVIGVRSYGQDPHLVASLGMAQVKGYQDGQVATSVKHFPGHGDTATDSHLGVPVIDKSLAQLNQVELVPFQHAVQGGADSIMVGHMALPQLTPSSASLGRSVVHDLLRQQMGYDGVIITDCLEMDAIKETVGCGLGAVMALQAGNDMVMISHTAEFQLDAFARIQQALDDDKLDGDALVRSLDRVAKLKDKYLRWQDKEDDLAIIGCPEHQALCNRLYDAVPTLVRNEILPLNLTDNHQKILFLAAHVPLTLAIDSEPDPFHSFYESLLRRHANTDYVVFDDKTPLDQDQIKQATYVIIGTANANLHPFQADLVQRVHCLAGDKLVVTAVINPYDLMVFPDIGTYLVTYEYTPPAHEAAVKVLFGEITAQSKLPVTIPSQSYDKARDLDQVVALWDHVFGEDWPLDKEQVDKVLTNPHTNPVHFVARQDNKVVGFAATMIRQEDDGTHGQLALLMVDPAYRNQGIGSQLHDTALAHLRSNHTTTLRLGSTYPRFFPGLPATHERFAPFFIKRRWNVAPTQVHDLMGDLTTYQGMPDRLSQRMKRERIWFGRLVPHDRPQLEAFQRTHFPYWYSTYRHHLDLGDYQDVLVARQDDQNGMILGTTIIYTTHVSHPQRADLIWTKMFGESHSGGMACVGVSCDHRGRGIGLGLVAYANQVLKSRGVVKSYVDWVELLDFYALLDYKTWRSYRTVTL
ncbi:glycoside hydrolase superfamily [Chlamydoabsidia padenii]|nr:glycoside hydrolase superfamily [Chlamydoabsidia padenii]